MALKLGMMMICVSDLEKAKTFYRDVLGFPIKSQHTDHVEFVHDGCDFIAYKCEQDATVENYSRIARSVFVFEVDSIDQSMRELRARGVEFLHQEPAENDFCRYAALLDPFGNVHELYERKA